MWDEVKVGVFFCDDGDCDLHFKAIKLINRFQEFPIAMATVHFAGKCYSDISVRIATNGPTLYKRNVHFTNSSLVNLFKGTYTYD